MSQCASQVYLVDRGSVRLLESGVKEYVKDIGRKLRKGHAGGL